MSRRRSWPQLFAPVPGMRPAVVAGLVNAVAVGLPLPAGIAFQHPVAGAWVCLGAYVTAFTNKGGPRRSRTLGLAVAAVVNAAAFAVGEPAFGVWPLTFVLFAVLVLIASLGDRLHPWAGRLGTMPATALLAGAGNTAPDQGAAAGTALLVLCGGLWYAVATVLLTPAPRLGPVLLALAEPYRLTGQRLARIAAARPAAPEDHAQAVQAQARAAAAVKALRGQGGDEHLAARLDPLLTGAAALADQTGALHTTGSPPPAVASACARAATVLSARLLRIGALLAHAPTGPAPAASPRQALDQLARACDLLRSRAAAGAEPYSAVARASRQRRLLVRIAHEADRAHVRAAGLPESLRTTRAHPAPPPRRGFDRAGLRAVLSAGSPTSRHALRVTLVASAVLAAVSALGLPHGEWATLAVLRVMRPRYADTMERAGQRVAGNLIGGTCAALAIAWIHDPDVLAALLFAVITVGFALRPVNYGFWVVFGTPLVLLIGDVSDPGDWRSALERIAMTVLGSAAALLGGYLLWPTWERGRLAARSADAAAAAAAYLDAGLRRLLSAGSPDGLGTAPEGAARARAAAEEALAAAADAERRARREPLPDRAAADRAATVIATLYGLVADVTALASVTGPGPAGAHVPVLPVFAAHAVPALTGPDADRRARDLAVLTGALDEMRIHLEDLHTRRQAELAAGREAEDTPVRRAIREAGPLVELLERIGVRVGQLARLPR
ncbi:FUSC family protein [Streptomyces sp. NBC_01264]|uniref:FUSC family protein n=1 Tax=Streptomyces sp. NBC_01264 TaxID=2903804 RepID=UPI002253A197|nr:FUSC family protein [Streptomyces sp. NBC_01264]MCX4781726.1 FUSC family protein [Streptomyces sp. NBC_01264]